MLAVWRKKGRIFKVSSYPPIFFFLLKLLFSFTTSVARLNLKKFINRLTY
ncbi:hypothetical protein DB42_DW00240 [Neochlamydia sp. EPS4]|nr:hypothetical protein DB42_DW00240 [Neochlamydia sp. EPS4]